MAEQTTEGPRRDWREYGAAGIGLIAAAVVLVLIAVVHHLSRIGQLGSQDSLTGAWFVFVGALCLFAALDAGRTSPTVVSTPRLLLGAAVVVAMAWYAAHTIAGRPQFPPLQTTPVAAVIFGVLWAWALVNLLARRRPRDGVALLGMTVALARPMLLSQPVHSVPVFVVDLSLLAVGLAGLFVALWYGQLLEVPRAELLPAGPGGPSGRGKLDPDADSEAEQRAEPG